GVVLFLGNAAGQRDGAQDRQTEGREETVPPCHAKPPCVMLGAPGRATWGGCVSRATNCARPAYPDRRVRRRGLAHACPLAMIRRSILGPALLNPFFPETLRRGPADLPDPPTAASFSEFFQIARAPRGKIGRICAASSAGRAR